MDAKNSNRCIESRNHPLLKRIRALVRSGELRDEDLVLLETPRLVEDALSSAITISTLLLSEPLSPVAKRLAASVPPRVEILRISPSVFQTLATTESSPGVLALAEAPLWEEQDVFPLTKSPAKVLVIAGVQDPGNLGTIVRAAEAFGFSGALLTRGTANPWNAKAFRAAAGSVLRLPMLRNLSPARVVQLLNGQQVKLYGAVVRGGVLPESIQLSSRGIAIAVGAEVAGLPEEIVAACIPLSIPMALQVDSLNVAAATAIILYEVCRRSQEEIRLGAAKRIRGVD